MKNTLIRTVLLTLLLSASTGLMAQQGLQIESIFKKYGRQKGVTMVELSNELVDIYEMKLYKSLVFKNIDTALRDILRCLETDKQQAKKVKEVLVGGQIQSGYYQLPQVNENINRFILFKTDKKGGGTLIYLEGELDTDDLITLLFMKDK